jgi:hypothetical protein
LHIDHDRVLRALAFQASVKRNPPITFDGLLKRLAEMAPMFVGEVRYHLDALEQRDPSRLRRLLDG